MMLYPITVLKDVLDLPIVNSNEGKWGCNLTWVNFPCMQYQWGYMYCNVKIQKNSNLLLIKSFIKNIRTEFCKIIVSYKQN